VTHAALEAVAAAAPRARALALLGGGHVLAASSHAGVSASRVGATRSWTSTPTSPTSRTSAAPSSRAVRPSVESPGGGASFVGTTFPLDWFVSALRRRIALCSVPAFEKLVVVMTLSCCLSAFAGLRQKAWPMA
jgi:hypothetical protein